NEFSQKSQITSIKREKCFLLVIDYYLKYCIEGRDLKITLSERKRGGQFSKGLRMMGRSVRNGES
ncbi:MAG: hypothetical protein ABSG71_21410, partial [Thermodesulfobacteriota bacterium]